MCGTSHVGGRGHLARWQHLLRSRLLAWIERGKVGEVFSDEVEEIDDESRERLRARLS